MLKQNCTSYSFFQKKKTDCALWIKKGLYLSTPSTQNLVAFPKETHLWDHEKCLLSPV